MTEVPPVTPESVSEIARRYMAKGVSDNIHDPLSKREAVLFFGSMLGVIYKLQDALLEFSGENKDASSRLMDAVKESAQFQQKLFELVYGPLEDS